MSVKYPHDEKMRPMTTHSGEISLCLAWKFFSRKLSSNRNRRAEEQCPCWFTVFYTEAVIQCTLVETSCTWEFSTERVVPVGGTGKWIVTRLSECTGKAFLRRETSFAAWRWWRIDGNVLFALLKMKSSHFTPHVRQMTQSLHFHRGTEFNWKQLLFFGAKKNEAISMWNYA